MPVIFNIQPKFSRGELSPRLMARADIEHWQAGLEKALNAYVMRQGGARRRPGTRHAGMARSQWPDDKIFLAPFVFSAGQSYLLEFTDLRIRFFALGGQVMSGGTPYEINTPWLQADLPDLRFTQSADVMYIVHKNYFPRRLVRYGETNWAIETVSIQDGPYLPVNKEEITLKPSIDGNIASGGAGYASSTNGTGYEPDKAFDKNASTEWMGSRTQTGEGTLYYSWAAAKVINSYYLQASNKVISYTETSSVAGSTTTTSTYYVPGGQRAPRTWTVEGSNDAVTDPRSATNWTILDSQTAQVGWGDGERRYYEFDNDTGYRHYRIKVDASNEPNRPVSIAEWALGGGGADAATVTLTLSGLTGVNDNQGFLATDVGRHVRFLSSDAYWHWYEILTHISATQVTARLRSAPLPNISSSRSFRLGAFSDTSGYPGAVVFYQERLVYGGSKEQPQTLWFSVVGDFNNFQTSTPLRADDALTLTLGGTSPVTWMAESDQLVVGTKENVRPIGSSDKSEGFSATNFAQGKPIQVGSGNVAPAAVGGAILFATAPRTSLRELAQNPETGGLAAPDIGLLSDHLLRPGIKQLAVVAAPNNIVWAVTDTGKLVAITYEREQNMLAMTPHEIAGPDAFVESIASILGPDRSELWMAVRRTKPGGGIVRTIEVLDPDFEDKALSEAMFLDSALTYRGAAASTITGLTHLASQSVTALADGVVRDGLTVSAGGELTLPAAASVVHIGFKYTTRLKTLPMAQGFGDGSALGRKRLVRGVIVHFLETVSAKVNGGGRDFYELIPEATLFTGSREIRPLNSSWDKAAQVTVEVNDPLPMTVLAITPMQDAEP